MEMLAAVGGGAFVLACLVLGVRLLLLWARTRELPELCIGSGLFLMGGLGYPLMMFGRFAPSLEDETRTALGLANVFCSVVGNTAVCVFNWRVFRPTSTGAKSLCFLIAALLVGLFIAQAVSPGFLAMMRGEGGPWRNATYFTTFVYAWAGFESSRYYLMLQKRQKLGLAEPLVADRFRLWAIGTFSAVVISGVGLIYRALGLDFQGSVASGVIIGTLGMLTAVCFWLAFLAPDWYRARFAASADSAKA